MTNFLTKLLINCSWIFLGLWILLSSFSDNILLGEKQTKYIKFLFPEGWGFFTKNPREELIDVYKINNDGSLTEFDMANTSRLNYYGFSRDARIKGYEIGLIMSSIPPIAWTPDSTLDITTHISDTIYKIQTANKYKFTNSGHFLLKLRAPIPWAWAGLGQEKYAPFKTVKIAVNE